MCGALAGCPLRHAFGMTPPPKGEARLGSPFGAATSRWDVAQRPVSAAASVGDGRSPLGCITRAGRREWTRVSEDGEGEALPAGKNASLFP